MAGPSCRSPRGPWLSLSPPLPWGPGQLPPPWAPSPRVGPLQPRPSPMPPSKASLLSIPPRPRWSRLSPRRIPAPWLLSGQGGRVSRDAAGGAHPSPGDPRPSQPRVLPQQRPQRRGRSRGPSQADAPAFAPLFSAGTEEGRGEGRGRTAPEVRAASRTLAPGQSALVQDAGCRCGMPGAAKEPGGRRAYLSGFTGGGPAWARAGARVPERRAEPLLLRGCAGRCDGCTA